MLTIDDVKSFLSACDIYYRVYFFVLYYAGLRGDEAKKLKWGDVDFSRNCLIVRKGKGNKMRVVPFDKTLAVP